METPHFPFPRSPAELRNQVYEAILLCINKRANNTTSHADQPSTCSYMGLAFANKRLRAKFLPTLAQDVKIWLRLYPAFLDGLSRESLLARTKKFMLYVGTQEALGTFDWDMRPAFLLRAKNRGLCLDVDASVSHRIHEQSLCMRSYDLALTTLDILSGRCRCRG